MDRVEYKARAKVNLGLDVCGRMPNGYHEVKMIMQTIDLYDELEFVKRKDPDIILSVDSKDPLGDIGNNLIFRATKMMREYFHIKEGVEIHLKKHIPVAAGMAGGSTDAAVTMLAMNELYDLEQTREQLMNLVIKLGADIPFCIMGGTALAEGIGEKLTPLPAPPRASVLIAKPPIMVSTKDVYQGLKIDELTSHPDIDGMIEALKQGNLQGITDRMENVLETVTVKQFPVIAQIKDFMKEHGAVNALMSGSGPTVFGIYKEEKAAKEAAEALRETGFARQIHVTEFYNGERQE